MAKNSVNIEGLSAALEMTLSEYRQEVADTFKKDVRKAANLCKREIQNRSPKSSNEYASGWSVRKEYESNSSISLVVFNSKKPSIIHLLENGHPIVSKKTGKVIGYAKAHPHVAPGRDAAEKKLNQDLAKDIGGIE